MQRLDGLREEGGEAGGGAGVVGDPCIGAVTVDMDIPELGFAIEVGEVVLTECETVDQFTGSKSAPPQFTRGYGLVFGQSELELVRRMRREGAGGGLEYLDQEETGGEP